MGDFFKRYRIIVLAVILLIGTLLLYSSNLRNQGATTLFERTVLTLSTPLQKGVDVFTEEVGLLWNNYLWLVDARQQNRRLIDQNRRLQSELVAVSEIRLENQRLRRLLDFVDKIDRPALPARVIAEDLSSWARTVVIDKGSEVGIRDGLPVVVAEGVVGRVIKTASNSARVLLITDASSAIASLVQRTRTRGVARGLGGNLTLDYAKREDNLQIDDLLVTSGMGGVFPKGLVVGRVVLAEQGSFGLFQRVEVSPAADFSRLEEVLVLLDEKS
ncbi:MAG TPA: rod shape-determining protein MreC [Geopsychrobacteraceae bacterium]|nr:rod shape-determining protein MreC [Geopsychrobacteraceae bacterium]